ncbi:uncharacterized protein BDZ99DRAFT_436699 [Mytilinidion resinicola]|uniref:Core domain-containing protein n=1 Tax=Mytilinidion resinicola TaxID=574789 RepID=A0A6A6YZP5_9PEZI|nr:uncharacterized protein BDZ99DRAFT_436699 [Mytilinidion resinicola]KAF2814008.1 hypothetical protein BDZ99DRAFT_436699 [Mytilinidion resinicola]
MASPSTMCTACLRSARRITPRLNTTARFPRPLASRSYTSPPAATLGVPLFLDFLAPAYKSRQLTALRSSRVSQSQATQSSFRSFSTTPSPQRAIHNPRKDENGEEMDIEITPRAANRLHQIMTNDSNPNLALRITVESGGCHGFQYLMSLTKIPSSLTESSSPPSEDETLSEDDTVFEGPHDTKVVIDESSLELLKGSKVDYTMELIGSQFKVVGIPGATSSCGCGTSFDVKI